MEGGSERSGGAVAVRFAYPLFMGGRRWRHHRPAKGPCGRRGRPGAAVLRPARRWSAALRPQSFAEKLLETQPHGRTLGHLILPFDGIGLTPRRSPTQLQTLRAVP